MKKDIHPNYVMSKVICACGATFDTRSTKPEIKLDICSECHPFFTGKQRLLDIAGRVEKFNKRFASTEGKTVVRKPKSKKAVKTLSADDIKLNVLVAPPRRGEDRAEKPKKEAKKEKKA